MRSFRALEFVDLSDLLDPSQVYSKNYTSYDLKRTRGGKTFLFSHKNLLVGEFVVL